ncbi:uncharacterized protein PG986_013779 [Apiospora aurea]|uniref:Uncharacterized protein n=1 Tax=Apiospora aurea TaxID=335848 RepID=A0ABR1PWK7_9PEZI
MHELKNILAELDRGKADQHPNGKWGFTIYRTGHKDQKLWMDYQRHLLDTIAVAPKADGHGPDTDANTEPDKKAKVRKSISKRIRTAFKLVVVEDPVLEGRTTAEVRQYHREKVRAYLDDKPFRFSGFPREENDEDGAGEGQGDSHAENAEAKVEDGDEEHEGEKPQEEQPEQPLPTPPQSSPPPLPRDEERVGHVWQDYFVHVNDDVLAKYEEARECEKLLLVNPALYARADNDKLFVAIVAEAERFDYRQRRFGAFEGDGSVPEARMAWQYVQIGRLWVLYDYLSRRPLGAARLGATPETVHSRGGGGGGGGGMEAEVLRNLRYGRTYTAIEADEHGPWYDQFYFPPDVNSM